MLKKLFLDQGQLMVWQIIRNLGLAKQTASKNCLISFLSNRENHVSQAQQLNIWEKRSFTFQTNSAVILVMGCTS